MGAVATLLPSALFRKSFAAALSSNPDISVIEGINFFNNTLLAVKRLGGMDKFVKSGQKVGLLINSDFEIPGTYAHPDIALAVVKMCFDAKASEVVCLQNVKEEYWKRSVHVTDMKEYLDKLGNETLNQFPAKFENGGFIKKQLPNSVHLKEAEIVGKLFDVDVLINIPIAKHHGSTRYTGALKNMMGVNTRSTNVFFHLKGPTKNDPVFLAQCIADINKVRKADLTVIDATSFITTNGPMGPGEMLELNKVMAGKDIVALDALACSYHDLELDEVPTLIACENAGLGTKDYTSLNVIEEKA